MLESTREAIQDPHLQEHARQVVTVEHKERSPEHKPIVSTIILDCSCPWNPHNQFLIGIKNEPLRIKSQSYSIVGTGHLKAGESKIEGAWREALEECEELSAGNPWYWDIPGIYKGKDVILHRGLMIIRNEIVLPDQLPPDHEFYNYRWCTWQEIDGYNFSPNAERELEFFRNHIGVEM